MDQFEQFLREKRKDSTVGGVVRKLQSRPHVVRALRTLWAEREDLRQVLTELIRAYEVISASFEKGGRLYVCGNGGSFADALHISGELMKSYLLPRTLPAEHKQSLLFTPDGEQLSAALQPGLPVIVLGLNHSLTSAVENDIDTSRIGFAQELYALGKAGDVLLGISTSGEAINVRFAMRVARLLEMSTVALTGSEGGRLAELVQVALCVPETETRKVQELHQPIYHALCAMLEAHFFA